MKQLPLSFFTDRYETYPVKIATDGLINALHEGNFDGALRFIEEGANGTREAEKEERRAFPSSYSKPLDWLGLGTK
ncbi:MAG: hypothetical protein V1721_03085 [Pseudomonadota bacterium]